MKCPKGHPMRGYNVMIICSPRGTYQRCRKCHNTRNRAAFTKRLAEARAAGLVCCQGRFYKPGETPKAEASTRSDEQLDREAAEWLAVRG